MNMKNFRSELRRIRPDAVREIKKNEKKREIALKLRSFRKENGMTQKDIERNSTLSQPAISRLESPSGPIPTLDTIKRYIEACGTHVDITLRISTHESDDEAIRDSQSNGSEPMELTM